MFVKVTTSRIRNVKILLTGATGYIGSGLTAYLKQNGLEVTKCDLGWFGNYELGNFANLNIAEFDTIIHLAGHSSVSLCENDKRGAWLNNVINFKNIVDQLSLDQTFIYASSGSVYGNLSHPASEADATLNSLMNYDMTKITKDVIALHAVNEGKKILGLRFGTVNGISPNTRIDLMLNSMMWNSLNENRILVKNPNIGRPILFIQDLFKAMLLTLERPVSGVYNLASSNVEVQQVAEIVQELTGATIERLPDDSKPYNFQLNCDLFTNTFGQFKSVDLEEVLVDLNERILNVDVGRRDLLSNQQMSSL